MLKQNFLLCTFSVELLFLYTGKRHQLCRKLSLALLPTCIFLYLFLECLLIKVLDSLTHHLILSFSIYYLHMSFCFSFAWQISKPHFIYCLNLFSVYSISKCVVVFFHFLEKCGKQGLSSTVTQNFTVSPSVLLFILQHHSLPHVWYIGVCFHLSLFN